jgi:hypothetical protein
MSTRCAHPSEGCSPEILQDYTSTSVEAICGHSNFMIPLEAVDRVHDGKVMVDVGRLDAHLREAIAHAHDREEPGA